MSTSNNCKAGDSGIGFKKPAKGKTTVHPQEDLADRRVLKVESSIGNGLDDDVFPL